jgi:hypothetical protein
VVRQIQCAISFLSPLHWNIRVFGKSTTSFKKNRKTVMPLHLIRKWEYITRDSLHAFRFKLFSQRGRSSKSVLEAAHSRKRGRKWGSDQSFMEMEYILASSMRFIIHLILGSYPTNVYAVKGMSGSYQLLFMPLPCVISQSFLRLPLVSSPQFNTSSSFPSNK